MFASKSIKNLNNAKKLIAKGSWNEAIVLLETLQSDPSLNQSEVQNLMLQAREGLLQSNLDLSRSLIRQKRYQEASNGLEQLKNDNPNHPDVTLVLAQLEDGIRRENQRLENRQQRNKKITKVAIALSLVSCVCLSAVCVISGLISDRQEKRYETQTQRAKEANLTKTSVAESTRIQLTLNAGETATQNANRTAVAALETATVITWTPTSTLTATSTSTYTPTPTNTPSSTYTFSPTFTATNTTTATPTFTPSATNSVTPTATSTRTSTATLTPSATSTPIIAAVVNNGVNARSCPSTSCAIVATVSSNDQITILGVIDDWYWVLLPDQATAYIFGELLKLPNNALTIPVAPTLTASPLPSATPSRTNTPRPTSTRRPTATPTEFVFDDETIISLIEITLISQGVTVNRIGLVNNNLVIDVPASDLAQDDVDYRVSVLGSVAGAVVAAYRDDGSINLTATPPVSVVVKFVSSDVVLIRVTFSYRDAVSFIDERMTPETFFSTWKVENQ